jgi:inosose dehydratase
MFPSLSRRRFLALSAAAAAGATWFDAPRVLHARGLADSDKLAKWGGWPLGVQSYSLRNFETPEVIRHLQGMGVHFVEFYSRHLDPGASDERIAEVKKLLDAADVTIAGHGVHGFGANHEANKRLFDFAKKIGVRVITADPAPDSFDSLEKLVAEYDIRIAIHNHGPNHRYNKLADTQRAIEGRDKRIGACVDCGHYLRSGEDPVKCVLELGDRVYGVHIKDERETNTPRSANVVIGKGHLDVAGLFKALRQVKFPADGALSLEYEANPQNPIDDMKACLEVAREAIAKAAG